MYCPDCERDVSALDGHCMTCGREMSAEDVREPGSVAKPDDDDATIMTDAIGDGDATVVMEAATGGGGTVIVEPSTEPDGTVVVGPSGKAEGTVGVGILFTGLDEGDGSAARRLAAAAESDGKDEGPLKPGQDFGSRYQIVRLLGLGGMGAVYQTWDKELSIMVALKIIRPEAAADPEMAEKLDRRFKRELLLAREVTHKNVVRIHDLGEIDTIKYITMTYIEGDDLETILKQQGTLPVPETLKITRLVVSGLVAAHEAGVVHRDLKPANIMISKADSQPLIMDFGIAHSTSDTHEEIPEAEGLRPEYLKKISLEDTIPGGISGTFAYMSPEQFRGEEADQRSDLYTMGLIVYDMLLGKSRKKRVKGRMNELVDRTKNPLPALRETDSEIPEAVDQLVSKCVETDRDNRFQSTEELEAALDRLDDDGNLKPIKRTLTGKLMAVAATVVIALLAGTFWFARTRAPEEAPDPMSILVADFQNETGDPSFDGALEQALNIAMEGAGFISAYSRSSAQETADELQPGKHLDKEMAQLISRREGIDVVLVGILTQKGSGYRISAEALDTALETEDAKPLAKASAKAKTKEDVLPAVGRLASDLRKRLGDTTPASARLAASETVTASSLEALQAYTRAQDLADANKNQEALVAYQETIELDPNFGRAYAGMGVIYTISKDEAKTKAAYEQALKLVDRMSEREKYRTLGTYYMSVARNYEKAIENYETLVELFPADNVGHGNLALAYLNTGNVQRALEEGRQALELYPGQWADRYNYAMYAMYAGDFDTALAEGARVVEQVPTFELAFLPVALSMLARGDFEGALSTYDQLEETGPAGASLARFGRADLEMYRGRYREALKILEEAIALDEEAESSGMLAQDYVAAAEAYLAVGETERGVEAARRAKELGSHESVLFPAALVFLRAGLVEEAEEIALTLDNKLQRLTSAYARLIDAEVAVSKGQYAIAIDKLRDSIERRDTWFARLLLGKVYVDKELYPEAMGELDLAIGRHGEVTDVFFYDTPSIRYLPEAYYWLARAQQPIGVAEARQNYEQFLALRADADPPDPLATDARERMTGESQ